MVENKTWLDEWKNPWFWFYIGGMILATIILRIGINTKTIAVLAMFSFPVIQLIYNLKYKLDKKSFPSGEYLRWAYFLLFLFFAIIYLSISLEEYQIAIPLLLFTVGSGLFFTSILNIKTLCKSRGLLGAIMAYLVAVFTIVVFFGFIYTISGTFENQGILNTDGEVIQNAWEYVYFSSSAFYTMVLDYSPKGFSRIIMQLELVASFIIHVFLLGILIPKIKKSKLFE